MGKRSNISFGTIYRSMIWQWTLTSRVHGPSAKVRLEREQMPLTLSMRKLQCDFRANSTIHYREPSANIAPEPPHSATVCIIIDTATSTPRVSPYITITTTSAPTPHESRRN